ncbi:hypothetical protein HG536_0H02790 [Torulaspora globosa]|uniref:type II protein arginine methyltransferase n=1 Tax=Torulaspora globosa TaxID=48254 RepID=A0A7G3ZN18_9SACH|nr:uncharacterized protein HG536_0H02790 [Torulaspora globosa]QLL34904.1 hypothetical protein HG536_0H02790 [Torulaspora globosa]
MRRFPGVVAQVRFKGSYPLIPIEQLRKGNGIHVGESGTLALRDYYEWLNLPSIMKHETFFTKRGELLSDLPDNTERLTLYDPILTRSIARWLLVDYKLNHYPYSDLNIINIYTDLPQSLRIAESMMGYFKQALSSNMFERIRYTMVPLHSHRQKLSGRLTRNIPGEVQIISDAAVFTSESTSSSHPQQFVIEDPVYFLMLNDIFKNTSHDLVRYNKSVGNWEQCYMDIHTSGGKSRRFDTDLDYWCDSCLSRALQKYDLGAAKQSAGFYIPTRLIQLFDLLKTVAPAHKLFAIDAPQRWHPSFLSMIRILAGYQPLRASKIVESHRSSIWRGRREDCGPRFTVDFTQIQQLYTSINESAKFCEVDDVPEFVNQWLDTGCEQSDKWAQDVLNSQLEMIGASELAILHSC